MTTGLRRRPRPLPTQSDLIAAELQATRDLYAGHLVNVHAMPVLVGLEQLLAQGDNPEAAAARRRWRDALLRLADEPDSP